MNDKTVIIILQHHYVFNENLSTLEYIRRDIEPLNWNNLVRHCTCLSFFHILKTSSWHIKNVPEDSTEPMPLLYFGAPYTPETPAFSNASTLKNQEYFEPSSCQMLQF